MTDRVTIVVPVLSAPRARIVAAELDHVGAAQTFGSPLSVLGLLPVTHYWTSWAVTAAERDWLLSPPAVLLLGITWQAFDNRTHPPARVLEVTGLRPVTMVTD